ncbi:nucleotidyltransferase family protein [Clostridium gasigenes]|uniref:Nucleotidyltransferase domain-containing protein n=1 Tax=Clostridium gasigenes TaxID=94869 RepID=A0A7X0SBD1_9CLOT|nr:nucleotidyltransferase domain-containing protein [Clostridium gasigenes]MBB6714432.1 nucleotidyltransferase domain-containing protein [Clostridium gasigenes]MBU3089411.1 nucleotidyltransferase domain-containing protein [Clostridium gasigenes]
MSTLYSKEEIINLLSSKDVSEILSKYPLTSMLIFGSIITDEFTEESDVDLALIGDTSIKLDNILDLEIFFENLLNREIDILDLRSTNLDLFVKINVLNNGEVIYSTDNNKNFNIFYDETDRIYKENENFIYFRKVDVLS